MSCLEYSDSVVWKAPSNNHVHNCNYCPFVSTSLFLMVNHVRSHRSSNTPFDCKDNINTYFCKDCDFQTNLTLFFKKHIEEYHIAKPENGAESFLSVQSYICKNCSFETYFSLAWFKHVITCKRAKPPRVVKSEGRCSSVNIVNSPPNIKTV